MARPIRQDASYICIRECFTHNKRFRPGEPFPENWLANNYKPNKHFAPAKDAHAALQKAQAERTRYGHGDDTRSTAELKKALAQFMAVDADWDRKKIWLELTRHENAAAKDGPSPSGKAKTGK